MMQGEVGLLFYNGEGPLVLVHYLAVLSRDTRSGESRMESGDSRKSPLEVFISQMMGRA